MRGLTARAAQVGADAAARAKRAIVSQADVPGVTVKETERGVTLSGRGLLRRLATDDRLRWIGGWLR